MAVEVKYVSLNQVIEGLKDIAGAIVQETFPSETKEAAITSAGEIGSAMLIFLDKQGLKPSEVLYIILRLAGSGLDSLGECGGFREFDTHNCNI